MTGRQKVQLALRLTVILPLCWVLFLPVLGLGLLVAFPDLSLAFGGTGTFLTRVGIWGALCGLITGLTTTVILTKLEMRAGSMPDPLPGVRVAVLLSNVVILTPMGLGWYFISWNHQILPALLQVALVPTAAYGFAKLAVWSARLLIGRIPDPDFRRITRSLQAPPTPSQP